MGTRAEGKLATAANVLSFSRVVAVPVIIWLILSSDDGTSMAATAVFAAAALTDFLDGLLARSTATITEVGKVLDPIADRILISGTILALTISGVLPIIGVVLVVARDIFLVFGYKAIERRGVILRVSLLGKTYTALFMVAIVLSMGGVTAAGHDIGLWFFWASVAGSMVSGISYTARGIVLLRARPDGSG